MSKITECLIVFGSVFSVGRFAVNLGLMGMPFHKALLSFCVSAAIFGVLILLSVKRDAARRK
jgi:hypothetical protein